MKKILINVLISIIFMFLFSSSCFASSNATYFYGEGIKISNDQIEILSNELTIDMLTSKIKNTILLNNTTSKDEYITITLPLENKEFSTTVHDIQILIDGFQVEYTKNENGEYLVSTKIMKNSGKKIEINYITDNDLNKAKVIKYNLDNYKGKTIGKVKFDLILPEKDIPLVEGIYPGHYTFDNDTKTISVEYYNYEVTTITREIIVQKETYHNLRYGREIELTEYDKKVLDNVEDWIESGIDIEYKKPESEFIEVYWNISELDLDVNEAIRVNYSDETIMCDSCKSIMQYVVFKQFAIDKKEKDFFENFNYRSIINNENINNPLILDIVSNIEDNPLQLKEKIICIEFAETEGNKELYVNKNENEYDPYYEVELKLTSERDILKTKESDWCNDSNAAKIIFVGDGINGESLNANDEEKIKYVNSINADLYIRVEIYDNDNKEVVIPKGYYSKQNYEVAKEMSDFKEIVSEEEFNSNTWAYQSYSTYENYKNEINDYNKSLTLKISNELFESNCEVPTIINFTGHRVKKDGKYVVEPNGYNLIFSDYAWDGGTSSFVARAIATNEAQKMIKTNRTKNEQIKEENEEKITNIKLINDEENIQEEINKKNIILIEEKSILINKDIIIYGSIFVGILICIITIIIDKNKKRKGEKENGRKEEK